ncbi:hypothetical protein D9M69_489930 [compost metagenome]
MPHAGREGDVLSINVLEGKLGDRKKLKWWRYGGEGEAGCEGAGRDADCGGTGVASVGAYMSF